MLVRSTFLLFCAHLPSITFAYFVFFSSSMPTAVDITQVHDPLIKQVLLPPSPLWYTRLHVYREPASAIPPLVGSHRIAHVPSFGAFRLPYFVRWYPTYYTFPLYIGWHFDVHSIVRWCPMYLLLFVDVQPTCFSLILDVPSLFGSTRYYSIAFFLLVGDREV